MRDAFRAVATLASVVVILRPLGAHSTPTPVCGHAYDCGYPGITQAQCEARGCCFDPAPKPLQCSGFLRNCSSAADCNNQGSCAAGVCQCDAGFSGAYCNGTNTPPYPQISTVHVINSCHLDIGFADSSAGIINGERADCEGPHCVDVQFKFQLCRP